MLCRRALTRQYLMHGAPLFAIQPLDGLQRWQMFIILISVVVSQLLVNIWMFYAKVRAAPGAFA